MSEKCIYIPVDTLQNFMKQIFQKVGVPEGDADICSNILIRADICGIDSHGINRLNMYIERIKKGILFPVTDWNILSDKEATAVIDGAHGMGHVVAYNAMKLAIEKAKKYGCGVVTVKNGTHFGIAGYYSHMAVENDMIGFAFTNARPAIAPTYGTEPLLGTNPISFGAPSNLPYPFLLDIATSISQRGKVEVAERLEEDIYPNLVIDEMGKSLTNPTEILQKLLDKKAAFLPLGGLNEDTGGHKGYGLATMVEILSTSLSGANFLKKTSGIENGKEVFHGLGHFFMAIDIERFIPVPMFKNIVGAIMTGLMSSRREPGKEAISIAGKREFLEMEKRLKEGIPLNKNLQSMMKQMKDEFKMSNFKLPF